MIGMNSWGLKGKCLGLSIGDEPLTLARYHSCEMSQLYEILVGYKSVCGQACNLGLKEEILCSFFYRFSSLFLTLFLFDFPSFLS